MTSRAGKYRILKKIGEGTFGEVLKGRDTTNGEIRALKKIHVRDIDAGFPNFPFREMYALKQLDHSNVIQLFEVLPCGTDLLFVFEYMDADLSQILSSLETPLNESQIKKYMFMLLKGIEYCHSKSIMHRDIKPSNLLVNRKGELKIADFGLSTIYGGTKKTYTHQVATRWYRAPELLFGSRKYTPAVDIWAIGVIFAELLNHSPLFPGDNDIDQIYRVMQILGTPQFEDWADMHELPDFNKITFPECTPIPWKKVIPQASSSALSLLQEFLQYNPHGRITATQALQHSFFFTNPLPADCCEMPDIVKKLKESKKNQYNNF